MLRRFMDISPQPLPGDAPPCAEWWGSTGDHSACTERECHQQGGGHQ